MILDARKGDIDWHVYDVKRCVVVRTCIWVNDETAQWGGITTPITHDGNNVIIITHQEDRITIYQERRLVLFNEIADTEPTAASCSAITA